MKKYILLAIAFCCVGVARTTAQSSNTEFDKKANFSQYKTYKWVPIKDAQQLDELTAEQLVGTVEVALAKKGLTKSKSDTADLYIGYQINSAKDSRLNQYNIGGSYGSAAGGTAANGGASTTTVHSGQLTLLMYDGATKQLVWHSMVANAIDAEAKPDKKQKHMDAAVSKLLKNYPPET